MTKKELRTFDRYRYGKRAFLLPGSRFRVSGGPYCVGTVDEGCRIRIPMNESGVFVFRRYSEFGASKWIEAHREKEGVFIIYVGRPRKSPRVDNLRLRPHKIRLVSERKKRRPPDPTCVQKVLFQV